MNRQAGPPGICNRDLAALFGARCHRFLVFSAGTLSEAAWSGSTAWLLRI
jgi:hypothetical protein